MYVEERDIKKDVHIKVFRHRDNISRYITLTLTWASVITISCYILLGGRWASCTINNICAAAWLTGRLGWIIELFLVSVCWVCVCIFSCQTSHLDQFVTWARNNVVVVWKWSLCLERLSDPSCSFLPHACQAMRDIGTTDGYSFSLCTYVCTCVHSYTMELWSCCLFWGWPQDLQVATATLRHIERGGSKNRTGPERTDGRTDRPKCSHEKN